MSHSQFHCTGRAYLDMHGLIFETSICYWQDQPGRSASWLAIVGRTDGRPSSEAGRTERASERAERGDDDDDDRHPGGRRDENRPRGWRSPVGTDGNPPEIPTRRRRERERARRRDADGRAGRGGRRAAGGQNRERPPAGNRRAAARRHALPRDTPRLLTTPRFRADGRGRGPGGRVWGRGGPPLHTRDSEAQRRGGRGDP